VIALLGDTHMPRGTRALPDECLRLLTEADAILHVGDFTELSVLESLRELGPVHAVHGNMDEWPVRDALPKRHVVEIEDLRIGLVHDAGTAPSRHSRLRAWFPRCGLVAYGHTHVPEVSQAGDVWIVNPGSPTERRSAPQHTMVVIESGVPRLVPL
jgi:putative phosphoesterase